MPTFEKGAVFAHPILWDNVRRANHKPTEEEVVKAKALINFLMQDRFFLEHFRSEDPKVRAAAMDTLNKAHHQAYGDSSAADDDAARGRH